MDAAVNGFVTGGLDWYGKNVTLTHNTVSVTGGSVVGRVAGARSFSGSDANFNSVYVQGAEIKAGGEYKGHVLGAANQSGGNALNNYVQVRDSKVEAMSLEDSLNTLKEASIAEVPITMKLLLKIVLLMAILEADTTKPEEPSAQATIPLL